MTDSSGTLDGFDLEVIGTLQGCIREDPERASAPGPRRAPSPARLCA
jgi:hypothetical protein